MARPSEYDVAKVLDNYYSKEFFDNITSQMEINLLEAKEDGELIIKNILSMIC